MKKDVITLSHGSGGKIAHSLLKNTILKDLKNPILSLLDDSAVFNLEKGKVAYTTDSYVVSPIFFRGGDIGKLAINGTINDLSMMGARPHYLTLSLIIEEGFFLDDLKKILTSIKKAADEAQVKVIAGDTKVVERGSCDKIFINTSGLGLIDNQIKISGSKARRGDKIILSGTIGEHEITILSEREGLDFHTSLKSDCAPLHNLVQDMLKVSKKIHALRDPTRGGLATTLNEIAIQSEVGIIINEEDILLKEEVKGACEMLGFDPLYLANEGKLVAFVEVKEAEKILGAMKKNKLGREARIIGEVIEKPKKTVLLKTKIGGKRIIDMLVGEALPRIC